jgi:hypothetical protein
MDVRAMKGIEDSSQDAVLDKATIDAIMCGPQGKDDVRQVCAEVDRVLSPGGAFILISHLAIDVSEAEAQEVASTRADQKGSKKVDSEEEDEEAEDEEEPSNSWFAEVILSALDWQKSKWVVEVSASHTWQCRFVLR